MFDTPPGISRPGSIPALLICAPDWGWVIAADVQLGINQGLTCPPTVGDLVEPGPRQGLRPSSRIADYET